MKDRLNPNALGLSMALLGALSVIGLVILAPIGLYTGALESMQDWHMFFGMDVAGIVAAIVECALWGYVFGALAAVFYNQFVGLLAD